MILSGKILSLWWCLPFAGVLLSIAIFPILSANFWHKHFGKIGLFWVLCFLLPWSRFTGMEQAVHDTLHAIFLEYIPFTSLIAALFIITGGIKLKTQWLGTPMSNTAILASGAVFASWIGTTGASMLLIRPLIRANSWRTHKTHTKIFFIFLVANIGGALTPLGDPPLFIGYMNGVDFFWTTKHLLLPMSVMIIMLLGIFLSVDAYYFKKEEKQVPIEAPRKKFSIEGKRNFIPLALLLIVVLITGSMEINAFIPFLGIDIPIKSFIRDSILWGLCYASIKITPYEIRHANGFSWEPFLEVAKLFFAIFITVVPVILILKQGKSGALGYLVEMVSDSEGKPIAALYFWVTGILSAFLDNAPTYLVYFHTAGGDADTLMSGCCKALMAISCGAVFMGSMTYIGNAPNFMVKAIAEQQGIKMPSFLGYMAWSFVVLVPLFILLTLLFF